MSVDEEIKQEDGRFVKRKTVLNPRFGGGPHGLGDPNDTHLRVVERDVVIPKEVRKICEMEECNDLRKVLMDCFKKSGLMSTFKCKPENKVFRECLINCVDNEDKIAEGRRRFLADRAEFRRTGLTKKQRKYAADQEEYRKLGLLDDDELKSSV